jgi:hypothetical protein
MKNILLTILFISTIIYSQKGENSLLKNFKPFETPRTNCRPGTVYRVTEDGVKYIVQDVKQIKSEESKDGKLIGQMTFSSAELLSMLNLSFSSDFVMVEVEISDATRSFTEQSNVDLALFENDIAEDILLDENSEYYLIRETVASQEFVFRFSRGSVQQLITGKSSLKEKSGEGIDFPFEIKKKFNEAKRFFYLEEKIEKPNGGFLFF